MARHYDYGMRGPRAASGFYPRGGYSADYSADYSGGYRPGYDERADRMGRTPRVTARYNRDYVEGQHGPRYQRNYHPYAGGPGIPMMDEYAYHPPYSTIGGTWTSRGTGRPTGYDRLYAAHRPRRPR